MDAFETFEAKDFLMNTVVEQRVCGVQPVLAYEQALAEAKRLEDVLSFFKEDSEISRINKAAGDHDVEVSAEVLHILSEAVMFSEMSGGAFDIGIAPVTALWRNCKKNLELPDKSLLERLLSDSGYEKINLGRTTNTVFLEHGCAIELGGIGKGYAADACVEVYKSLGVHSAFVNFGGNVKVLGSKPDGADWMIGIQHPDKKRDEFLGAVAISDKSVVTSGGYERFFEIDGEKYHHIIDPRTGWPVESNLKSVSVVCENSMQADALSTAAFVLGLEDGTRLISKMDETDAIFVSDENEGYMTNGLRDSFFLSPKSEGFKCYAVSQSKD